MSVFVKVLSASFASAVFVSSLIVPVSAEQNMSFGPATGKPVSMPMVSKGVFFRQISSVGQTKPRGSSVDARGGTTRVLDEKSRRLNWLINNSICSGCLPDHL